MARSKGVPGLNRGGRPKGSLNDKVWTDALRMEVMAMRPDPDNPGKKEKAIRLVARKCVTLAVEQGDMAAIKEIGDRLDGKAMQPNEHAVSGDINVEIVRYGEGASAS